MRARTLKDVLRRAHLSEGEEQRVISGARIGNTVANRVLAVAHAIRDIATDFPARHSSYWH